MDPRRALPSVGSLLDLPEVASLAGDTPRSLVVAAARHVVELARLQPDTAPRTDGDWAASILHALRESRTPSLRRVLNGTGTILHTNLGRAPLARAAIDAMVSVAGGYSNLEYELGAGVRGSRYTHCASLLRELTGADDALVVNNNAAAVVLALNTLASGMECIVSRGELVEIGGSFRVPEIMERSGARLVEVGTTNRTRIEDYERAIGPSTGVIAKIHPSNFAMEGFVSEADVRQLVALGEECKVPVLHDLGSGLLVSLERVGLRGEPTASEVVAHGASVVTMSGDKLLGGPQAGIILGRADTVAAIRANPLTRSYRVDKLTLAALEATLSLYRDPDTAFREIPVLRQLTAGVDALRARAADVIARGLAGDAPSGGRVAVVESEAAVGGGAFPTARIPSIAIRIDADVTALERRLREGDPPVIARSRDGAVHIDMRTILPDEDNQLVAALGVAL